MKFLRKSTAATLLLGPLVDGTDGFTPETGLTSGGVDELVIYKHDGTSAVDISGTTTFTHRAGGMYTATLSTADTGTNGRLTIYVRDDDVCRPVSQEYFVIDGNSYDILFGGTLNNIVAGFGSSSPNTLHAMLVAMMSKTATVPTGVGTYSPSTDSLEKTGEEIAIIKGTGFSASTDSLEALRDAFDTSVAPAVVSASALSGSGFLSDCITLIRKMTDEPSTNPKYTDADLVELLQAGIDTIITEIHANTDHPIMVRHNITLVDGTQDYVLPPQVGELIRFAKINTTTGLPDYEVWPGGYQDPTGAGHG